MFLTVLILGRGRIVHLTHQRVDASPQLSAQPLGKRQILLRANIAISLGVVEALVRRPWFWQAQPSITYPVCTMVFNNYVGR